MNTIKYLLLIILIINLLIVISVNGNQLQSQINQFSYSNVTIPSENSDDPCSFCTVGNENNYYCPSQKTCITDLNSGNSSWPTCKGGYCNSDSCQCYAQCMNTIWPCSNTVVGDLMLMAAYGVLLAFGAKFISDGSEGLMEILDPGLIGGLVLPILSALPDAIIIVVAGAFGSNPQAQLSIGIGTLAGSTIMLMTIPWSLSLILSRCDIRGGQSVDGTLTNKFSLTKTGTTVDDDTPTNAKVMILTSISYLIVQGVAFAYLKDPDSGKSVEKWFALVGFIVCFSLMAAYCTYQVISPKLQEKKMTEAKRSYLQKRIIHHFIHNLTIKRNLFQKGDNTQSQLITSDQNGNGENSPLISNEHKKLPVDIKAMGLKWKKNAHEQAIQHQQQGSSNGETSIQVDENDEKEEKEEGPINKKKIALQSAGYLLLGTAMASIFSDPMVDVITSFGEKLDIGLFYISFIITPFCSNASELISSLIFSSKKKKANSSLCYSALYGSATMNSTLCLGIFFALVFFRNLTWEFSAEVVSILFVVVSVGLIGSTQKTMKTYLAPIVLSLYPLSLLLVFLLEKFANWQ
ncbi:hypothetical protein DDB_G0278609 [Dictyostelium discoideum AX4]|uniref:Sodium/calcium exchanger membrane region domain-containing protein n=1 Tax=Dictyostelium discoideum TaxID=44689 RepID=Q54YQ8_DICDI|nr:hypothetical protein DDB_G0278609 [Dictyostelium discoideum AX4]EAL68477.1 hypothetical protein DDB_G0278609 [Dictyostelium discoideum AX4]|eukprot:XP_642144.1 hypothetical protein DDB_G0278609 [Dictyostelium discoideum AX4]